MVVAKVLGINAGTAYTIVKTGRQFKLAKGGVFARKIDNEIVSKAVEFLEEHLLTLKQWNSQLRAHLQEKLIITEQALSRALEGQLNIVKVAKDCAAERSSSSTIDARDEFAQWLIIKNCINEYGCSIHTLKSHGLANIGQSVGPT